MTNPDSPERTASGVLGHVVGRAKSAIGSLLHNEDLQREGNLQQAQAEAEADAEREQQAAELERQELAVKQQRAEAAAERDRLQAELQAEDRKVRIEEQALQHESQIAAAAVDEQIAIHQQQELKQRAADATENAAVHRRAADAAAVEQLRHEAKAAERSADFIDPEEK